MCDISFSTSVALDCLIGGFRTLQHNEVRDLVADVVREAQYKVEVEPLLQPLTGETLKYRSANKEEDARSDVKVLGFWSKMRQAYFDIKVVSPCARSYLHLTPAALYRKMEQAKVREYRSRINDVEHETF